MPIWCELSEIHETLAMDDERECESRVADDCFRVDATAQTAVVAATTLDEKRQWQAAPIPLAVGEQECKERRVGLLPPFLHFDEA